MRNGSASKRERLTYYEAQAVRMDYSTRHPEFSTPIEWFDPVTFAEVPDSARRCPECDVRVRVPFRDVTIGGTDLGKIKGYACPKSYFPSAESRGFAAKPPWLPLNL